jgi:hypothetical protein
MEVMTVADDNESIGFPQIRDSLPGLSDFELRRVIDRAAGILDSRLHLLRRHLVEANGRLNQERDIG